MRYALSATAAAMLISTAALAGPELIEFPEGYENSFTPYATVNRGSVLVMEIYKAKLDADENPVVGSDGFFEQGEMAGIAVMESRAAWGEEYPEQIRNGTWEYAFFDPKEHTLDDRAYQPCFECHKPLQEFDYVFSFAELREAAGN